MTHLKRITLFGLLFFVVQAKSQTLRQLLLNSDVICIVQNDSITYSGHFFSDAFEQIQTTSHITVAEWLKPPAEKKIPQEIVCKMITGPTYSLESGGYGIGEIYATDEVFYTFLFLKKEKKNYKSILSYSCRDPKAHAIRQAIEKAVAILKLKNDTERYTASVDFILSQYILNDPANFLTERSYNELLPGSVFVRYYKQKGIITDATILSPENKQRLMNFIIQQLNEGNNSYEYRELIPLFYDRFVKETDLAIANCLKKNMQKEIENESDDDRFNRRYEIGNILSLLYACNKSYNLQEYYFSDDNSLDVKAENLIDEIEKRYLHE